MRIRTLFILVLKDLIFLSPTISNSSTNDTTSCHLFVLLHQSHKLFFPYLETLSPLASNSKLLCNSSNSSNHYVGLRHECSGVIPQFISYFPILEISSFYKHLSNTCLKFCLFVSSYYPIKVFKLNTLIFSQINPTF